ncbi:hypothetical protein HPB51_008697 [Rhipicephalus microplus]|uniref:Uncharacterized protein n=1 Tax=Rhipicephalus microplus TaxID=6941 RepID=A0A9J6EZU9_RHIMP|nr:hypothetical protein HPB51_008697 [Rhipicephalus microplus]
MPTMPPGVPAMLSHQLFVGNAAMPYYGLQQQHLYSYEDMQMLQTRMPPLGYYDMQYPVPATSLAGRDLTLNNMAFAEGSKFGRGENSDSSPGTVAGVGPQGAAAGAAAAAQGGAQGGQQGAPPTAGQQAAASQPFLSTLPPGYGYYYPSNIMPGSIHHYGPPPMFPSSFIVKVDGAVLTPGCVVWQVPPATNAHGPTTSAQFQKARPDGVPIQGEVKTEAKKSHERGGPSKGPSKPPTPAERQHRQGRLILSATLSTSLASTLLPF